MKALAIEIENLTVEFHEETIFSQLNMVLLPGKKLTLVGKSGSGKSTLLHCLLGFVAPRSGTIRIFGEELNEGSAWRLRKFMTYVAQEPELGEGKIRDVLERPFNYKTNRHLQENLSRIPSLMQKLELPKSLLDKEPTTLSGGEKQRFALISALLLDRKILLLDEPSSALDKTSKDMVIDLLKSQQELTILSVSHDKDWLSLSDGVFEFPHKTASSKPEGGDTE